MRKVAILLLLGCIFFALFPQIDLIVSSFFYHEGFYLKDTPFARFIYKATIITTAAFGIGLLLLLVIEFITKNEWVKKRVVLYLLAVLALGPGLIVNELFKNHFGRARPSQIAQFGGTKTFTPALLPTNQCKKNCSFSSGHAAAAFYFLALVPLVRKRKLAILIVALLWGWLVGMVRIVQGGHFLSDVYCSMVVDILVIWFVYYLFFERKR